MGRHEAGDPDHRDLLQSLRGHQLAAMLHVAADMALADKIGTHRSVDDLAIAAGADKTALNRLLRALSAFGVFQIDADGTVRHTPKSELLRQNAPGSLRSAALFWATESSWTSWRNLGEAIREGRNAFNITHGRGFFEHLAETPAEATAFDAFMSASPDDRHRSVAEVLDLSSAASVIDVAGGDGTLLRTLLSAFPHLRGALLERREVVPRARKTLEELDDRCEIVEGDFRAPLPSGFDVYLLSQIVHDWDDEDVIHLLRNCAQAMAPGGRLLVIERRLATSADEVDPLNYLSDMEMLVLLPGRERTDSEYRSLAGAAGLQVRRITQTRSPFAIFELVASQAGVCGQAQTRSA